MHNARAFSKADGTEGLAREPEDIQVACRRSLIVAGGQVFVEAHRRAAVPLVQQVPHVARHLRGEDVLVRNAQHFERETCRARSRLRQNEVEENKLKSDQKNRVTSAKRTFGQEPGAIGPDMHLPGGQLVFKPSCFGNGVGATCEVSEAAAIALGFFLFLHRRARALTRRARAPVASGLVAAKTLRKHPTLVRAWLSLILYNECVYSKQVFSVQTRRAIASRNRLAQSARRRAQRTGESRKFAQRSRERSGFTRKGVSRTQRVSESDEELDFAGESSVPLFGFFLDFFFGDAFPGFGFGRLGFGFGGGFVAFGK